MSLKEKLQALLQSGSKFTKWQNENLELIEQRLNSSFQLTQEQIEIVNDMYRYYIVPKNKEAKNA